jgi:hypothetical protein
MLTSFRSELGIRGTSSVLETVPWFCMKISVGIIKGSAAVRTRGSGQAASYVVDSCIASGITLGHMARMS